MLENNSLEDVGTHMLKDDLKFSILILNHSYFVIVTTCHGCSYSKFIFNNVWLQRLILLLMYTN